MKCCCENCGWSEIIGSPIMCNYNGHRTWRDECCEAWKPKEEMNKNNMVKVIPEELKHKMWNALYAEEDEYEKKFVGKEEHLNWFTVYRPWLQKGFDIAINAIADWEGR